MGVAAEARHLPALPVAAGPPWATPVAIARAIVGSHPGLLTLDAAAASIVDQAISAARGLSEFATAISRQGPATAEGGWATLTPVGMVGDLPAVAYQLSPLTLLAATPVIVEVIRATQADPQLREQIWYPNPAALGGYFALPTPPGFTWAIGDLPLGSGLRVNRVCYQRGTRGFTAAIANLAPRTLAIYVEFLGADGRPLVPDGWPSRLPPGVDHSFETETSKFLALLPPTRRIEGIAMPEADLDLRLELPAAAVSARLSLAGLAAEPWSAVTAPLGAITSALLGYAVPAMMRTASCGDFDWYRQLYTHSELLDQVLQAGLPLTRIADLASAYDWLTTHIGGLLYGSDLPALQQQLLQQLGTVPFAEAAATISWAPALLALTTAPKAPLSPSTLTAPSSFTLRLAPQLIGDLELEVYPDPVRAAWPTSASQVQLSGVWIDAQAGASRPVSGLATASPQRLTLTAVPANRALLLEALVSDAQGRPLASATVQAQPSMDVPRRVHLALQQVPPALDPCARWAFAQSLSFDAQLGHFWGSTDNSATRASLDGGSGGHHLSALVGIQLSADGHALAYTWQASGQNLSICGASGPTDAQVHGFQTLSALAVPQSGLEFPGCAFSGQPNLAFAGTDSGYFVDPRKGVARLRRFELGQAFDMDSAALSFGRFNQLPLSDLLIVPGGYALAISTAENALLTLVLGHGSTEPDEPLAAISGGPGTEPGRLGGPVALALAPFGTVLVLENLNQRIQAVDVHGNPVPYFPGESATLSLNRALANPTYLDLAVDFQGYLYVLLYLGSGNEVADYCLDLYAPDGAFLARTTGVNAARIAVDRWRNVYTLDYSTLLGPGDRTEPGIRVFALKPLQGDAQ